MKIELFSALYWKIAFFGQKTILLNGIKQIQHLPRGIILDVGCGQKPYLSFFQNKNIVHYFGLDLFPKEGKVDTIGDGVNLPIRSEIIDTLLTFNAINTFSNPAEFFGEASRVLKPSGILILTTGFMYPIWNRSYDRWRITKIGLSFLSDKNGFTVKKIVPLGQGFWITTVVSLGQYMRQLLSDGIKSFLSVTFHGMRPTLQKLLAILVSLPLILTLPVALNALFGIAYLIDRALPSENHAVHYLLVAWKPD